MKVTIYTTPTCPYCVATKQYFRQNNVKYTEKDVAFDEKAREKMISKSGQRGVPVIVVSNEKEHIIIGWDKSALDNVLGLGGHAITHVRPKKKKLRSRRRE